MAIGKIKASRVNRVDAPTYVGEEGILFYNFANGVIRLSDGVTSGGVPIPYNIASNTTIGGIKAGPGVVVSDEGVLFIDTANLALSFGNFTANNNVLSIVNVDDNMILNTLGNAEIQLVGNIGFYRSNGNGTPTVDRRYFEAREDGQILMYVSTIDQEGAVQIIGSNTGNTVAPGLTGAMLHITGQIDQDCRLYYDGNGGYVAVNHRAWNGNIASGIQSIKAGDDVLRLNATAATTAGMGNVAFAQMRYTAIEEQTPTTQGSNINFWTTAIGTSASTRVQVANISVANGVSATKFTGPLIGNLSGTVLTAAQPSITSVGTLSSLAVSGNITANGITVTGNTSATGFISGNYVRTVRDAGTIADGGTVTVDFSTDAIIRCAWSNSMSLAYSNFIAGRVVKVMCTKITGTGTDSLSLGGLLANQVSTGATTVSSVADITTFIELTCINGTLSGVYAKL